MNDLEKILGNLHEQVELIEKSYNPDHLNLHFDIPTHTEPSLFEDLSSVGLEAWNVIQINQSRETSYWFYDFFLLISSASMKILNDHTQKYYSHAVIERLVLLLIEISQLTTKKEYEGDIRKRNYEALATLLLAFDSYSDLRTIAITRAEETNNRNVINFVKWTVDTVSQIENKGTARIRRKNMIRKTEGIKILVQDVLTARSSEIYDEDIILNVCKAIEDSPEWRSRYDDLSEDLRDWVVNNWIGKYVKAITGLYSLREVSVEGQGHIIKGYTKLGHGRG